jgi:hypothetical protein
VPQRRSNRIPFGNRNHTGWWIASFIERFEFFDENLANPKRRCLAHENTVLVRASNRDVAYRKAVKIGRASEGSEGWDSKSGRRGAWRFEGLTGLLPMYEALEDGAELLWRELSNVSVRKVKTLVRAKKDLSVFDDRERSPANPPLQRTGASVALRAPCRTRR